MKARNARPHKTSARPRATAAAPHSLLAAGNASNHDGSAAPSSDGTTQSTSPAPAGPSTTTASAAVQTIHISPRRRITRALLKGTALTLSDYAEATSGEATNSAAGQVTTSSSTSSSSATAAAAAPVRRVVVVGGVLRCVCNAFLIHAQESLLECSQCRNWCHPACVGVDHVELKQLQRQKNFVCPYCTGAVQLEADGRTAAASDGGGGAVRANTSHANGAAGQAGGSAEAEGDGLHHTSMYFGVGRQPPAPRQIPLKLREVPDRLPERRVEAELTRLLHSLRATAGQMGYDVLDLPSYGLSEDEVGQCVECCAEAVREATFSESYPVYCLKEVRTAHHSYVQGTLLRSRDAHVICSLVLSNGMDVYGNLRPTLIQLKSAVNRGLLDPRGVTETMRQCLGVTDVSDFVHITLSATHVRFRNRGLARLLLVLDLVKWALRGRRRAFLNMAIEKHLVQGGTRVEHVSPQASRRLYHSLGFDDVYPRYDPVTKAERWTAREADMGRVMANLDFVPRVVRLGGELVARAAQAEADRSGAARQTRPRSEPGRRREDKDGAGAVLPAWSRTEEAKNRPATRRALRLYREASGAARAPAPASARSPRNAAAGQEDTAAATKRRRLSLAH